jgi:hypothetical protein
MSDEQFPLDLNAAKLVESEKLDRNHVAGSRKAEEDAALAELLRLSGPATRDVILKSLEPESRVAIVAITNPEMKRLYEKIASIRRADYYAERREESKALATRFGLAVTLAVVDPSTLGASRARVVRDLYAEPSDLVLLRDDATPEDVAGAMALVMRSRVRFGDHVAPRLSADLTRHAGKASPSQRAAAERFIAKMKAAEPVEVPGYGKLRTTVVRLGPVKAK